MRRSLAGSALLAALLACASDPGSRNALPPVGAADADPALGFEHPPTLRASELLPPEILAGPHHRVDEAVGSDGFVHLYSLHSEHGDFQVAGDEMLRRRIREIEALAMLDEMSATREFAAAAARGLESPFVATWNLIRHPVDSVTGIPAKAWEVIRRTSELARSERGALEESAFREFIGFETRKRELAYRLNVDPYSSNKALQTQLNRFAWVSYAGEFPFLLVPFQGEEESDEPPPDAPTTGEERLAELLRDYSPEDLRRLNRIELAVIGVPEPLARAFLDHDWFSPRHETVFVEALGALEAESSVACVEVALRAGSEFDALFYQRAAEMLRVFDESRAPIRRCVAITASSRVVLAGVADDGTLVVPELVDHLVWTRPAAELAEALVAGEPGEGPPVRRRELLLSGTLSPKARAELEARGIAVTAQAFERLSPATAPRAALDP